MTTQSNLSDAQKSSVIKSLPSALVLPLIGDLIVERTARKWLAQQLPPAVSQADVARMLKANPNSRRR